MADEKKSRSWIGKLQPKKSSCCNMVIEELDDDGDESSCCGVSIKKHENKSDEAKPAPGAARGSN